MGGSIHRGYDEDLGYTTPSAPQPEYNIDRDPAAAQELFHSGVPIFMLPLDSTQIKFDETKRALLPTISTPMTDSLQLLIAEWQHATRNTTPTLFDPVAAAYAIDPATCPMTPLHIEVDANGLTRATPGPPNAQACLEPHPEAFFNLLMPRLLHQKLVGNQVCRTRGKQ
jgi:purine nucleosidase